MSTKEKRQVARITVDTLPELKHEIERRRINNTYLSCTDIVYQLVGERLTQIRREEEIKGQRQKEAWDRAWKIADSFIISQDVKDMSEEEFDEMLERDFSRKSPR